MVEWKEIEKNFTQGATYGASFALMLVGIVALPIAGMAGKVSVVAASFLAQLSGFTGMGVAIGIALKEREIGALAGFIPAAPYIMSKQIALATLQSVQEDVFLEMEEKTESPIVAVTRLTVVVSASALLSAMGSIAGGYLQRRFSFLKAKGQIKHD